MMLSNRPYLARAFYQWIVDSECTPILVLDANHPRCAFPMDHVEDGEMVLNISPSAIRDLKISNHSIDFKASFSGIVHDVYAPIRAIIAIYAEENGEGIFFDQEDDLISEEDVQPRVHLKPVDSGSNYAVEDISEAAVVSSQRKRPVLTIVE